jgi:hypothetical protein
MRALIVLGFGTFVFGLFAAVAAELWNYSRRLDAQPMSAFGGKAGMIF